jgi:hypothetical protein
MEDKCTCEEESKYGFHFGCGYCRGQVKRDQDRKKRFQEKLDEFELKLQLLDNWSSHFKFEGTMKRYEQHINTLVEDFRSLRKEIPK